MANVEIVGLDRLLRKLDFMGGQLQSAMRKPMDRAIKYVHSQVPPYPAPPVASTYTRTGTLGRSITTAVKSLGGQTVGTIGTKVIYAPYVIDVERQASVHRGRWWTLYAVVRESIPGVVRIFANWVGEIAARRM